MFSPHTKAKLYSQFVFTDEEDEQVQKVNFMNYKSIMWVFEKQIEKGHFQQVPALVMDEEKCWIKTNSLTLIQEGDVIWLPPSPPWPKGKLFEVAEAPQIEIVYCPKPRQSYQHIALRNTQYTQINPTRSEDD
jgi:hypothetical protein